MEKAVYSISINAPREKVWQILWGEDTYPQWTEPFCSGSNAVTDWQEGSKVLFTDGSGSGMIARIAKNIPNEYLSIEHLGELKDGVEDTESDRVKEWAGALENYTLKETGAATELVVDMDMNEEFIQMFTEIWPKALAKVKELAEA